MASNAGPFKHAASVIAVVIAVCAASAGIWAIVNGAMAQARGDYAGFHFGTAQHYATNALVATYGKDATSKLSYAKPPVVNTHLANALTGTGQVRIFHLIGPAGVKYCVSIWDGGSHGYYGKGGIWIGSNFNVDKGCKF